LVGGVWRALENVRIETKITDEQHPSGVKGDRLLEERTREKGGREESLQVLRSVKKKNKKPNRSSLIPRRARAVAASKILGGSCVESKTRVQVERACGRERLSKKGRGRN